MFKRISYKEKIKNIEIELDILYRPYILSFGIDIGSNHYNSNLNKKRGFKNFFIEIGLLFWTFGLEINWG